MSGIMKPTCTTAACADLSRYESAGKCSKCYRKYHRANKDKLRKYMPRATETRQYEGDIIAADDRESKDFKLYKAAVAAIVVKLKKATLRQIKDRIVRECKKTSAPNRERWLMCALESLQLDEVIWHDKKHAQISVYRAGIEIQKRYSKQQSVFGLL